MKGVIVIGAGGHAAEVSEYIRCSADAGENDGILIVGFLDDKPENYARYQHVAPLLGGIEEHAVRADTLYVCGIANLEFRRPIVERFLKEGAQFGSVIHKGAYLSPSATLGQGVVVGPNANVGPNVCVGDFNLLNARCSLGHDTRIGDFNFISPNVCFSGFTQVGDNNLFGINAATIPGIHIGNNNKIAAGMVLDKNVGDGEVVFYRFRERVVTVPKAP